MTKNKSYVYYFSIAIFLTFFLHLLVLSFLRGKGTQLYLFSFQLGDFAADFFNVLRYTSERDPYFCETNGPMEHNLPPLAYILLYPLSRMQPYDIMSLQDCWASPMSILSLFLYLSVLSVIFAHSLYCLCKKWNVSSIVIVALFTSSIYITSVERANLAILSAVCVCYFIAFYDSTDIKLRLFACFSLAFAAAIKIYPVLFALLLIEKKQYKEILWGLVWCVLLGLLPFLFFKHGFGNIPRLLYNLSTRPQRYTATGCGFTGAPVMQWLFNNINIQNAYEAAMLFGNIVRILSASALLLSLMEENFFRKLSLIMFAFMALPGFNGTYVALCCFPLILYCISIGRTKGKYYAVLLYIVLFLFLTPLQIIIAGHHLNFYFIFFTPVCFFIFVYIYSTCMIVRIFLSKDKNCRKKII